MPVTLQAMEGLLQVTGLLPLGMGRAPKGAAHPPLFFRCADAIANAITIASFCLVTAFTWGLASAERAVGHLDYHAQTLGRIKQAAMARPQADIRRIQLPYWDRRPS